MSGLAWVMLCIIERRMHNAVFLPIFVFGSVLIMVGIAHAARLWFDEW